MNVSLSPSQTIKLFSERRGIFLLYMSKLKDKGKGSFQVHLMEWEKEKKNFFIQKGVYE